MFFRQFTHREKLILGGMVVVLLAVMYVLLVHHPIEERYLELEASRADAELALADTQAKAYRYNSMQAELEEIFSMDEDEITVMPPYDNLNTLLTLFNGIFIGSQPQFSYAPPEMHGNVAVRTIRISYTASSYEQARSILEQLTGTGYRCLVTSLSISPRDGDITRGPVSVEVAINFYELVKNTDSGAA